MQRIVFVLLSALVALSFGNDATCDNWCQLGLASQEYCTWDFAYGPNGTLPDALALQACLLYCGQFKFPLGNFNMSTGAGDTYGNTIGCRLYHLTLAVSQKLALDVSIHCAHGSFTGGDTCGDYCETYCLVEENSVCSSTYKDYKNDTFNNDACMAICKNMPKGPTNQGMSNHTKWDNSVQCRTYHAFAAQGATVLSDPTANSHCTHASPHGGSVCGDRCEGYCAMLNATCLGHEAGFAADYSSCLSSCKTFFDAELYDRPRAAVFTFGGDPSVPYGNNATSDDLACRTYHGSTPAFVNPSFHCAHASLEGGGVCNQASILAHGDGNLCPLYCDLATKISCSQHSIYTNNSYTDCMTACANFSTAGTFMSTTGNNIHCRIYHLFAAMSDPVTHCPHGSAHPTAYCIDEAPAPGTTSGTPAPATSSGAPAPATSSGAPAPSSSSGAPAPATTSTGATTSSAPTSTGATTSSAPTTTSGAATTTTSSTPTSSGSYLLFSASLLIAVVLLWIH